MPGGGSVDFVEFGAVAAVERGRAAPLHRSAVASRGGGARSFVHCERENRMSKRTSTHELTKKALREPAEIDREALEAAWDRGFRLGGEEAAGTAFETVAAEVEFCASLLARLAGWLDALCWCGHLRRDHGIQSNALCWGADGCPCTMFRARSRASERRPVCTHSWTDWSRYGLSHATWECPEALVARRCARCGATETRAVGPDGRVSS